MKPKYIGNVREVYDISDNQLVIVSTDRLSVHGKTLPWELENKGIMLTEISNFWFSYTKDIVKNHLVETNTANMPAFFQTEYYSCRSVLVEKLRIIPYEFIVRGYMYGRLWKEYSKSKEIKSNQYHFNGELQFAEKLIHPILTPTIKLDHNRDIDVEIDTVRKDLGNDVFEYIREVCLTLYERCSEFAYKKGLIIADTKFEFGINQNNDIILADEMFTPDSSRYWEISDYSIGTPPKSFDKQLIRDWLANHQENNQYQHAKVPYDIIVKTQERYAELHKRLLS